MNNSEQLEELNKQVLFLVTSNEKTNSLISEALCSTIDDLTAANHVINLYSELTKDLGIMAGLLVKQVEILKNNKS